MWRVWWEGVIKIDCYRSIRWTFVSSKFNQQVVTFQKSSLLQLFNRKKNFCNWIPLTFWPIKGFTMKNIYIEYNNLVIHFRFLLFIIKFSFFCSIKKMCNNKLLNNLIFFGLVLIYFAFWLTFELFEFDSFILISLFVPI